MTKPAPMFPVEIDDNTPKIKLAGREWPVVPPAIKQGKKIVAALVGVMPNIARIMPALESQDAAQMTVAMSAVDEAFLDAISNAVYWSLVRGTPGLALGEFEEMPIEVFELLNALPVVMAQIGWLKAGKPGDKPAGEAPAGAE